MSSFPVLFLKLPQDTPDQTIVSCIFQQALRQVTPDARALGSCSHLPPCISWPWQPTTSSETWPPAPLCSFLKNSTSLCRTGQQFSLCTAVSCCVYQPALPNPKLFIPSLLFFSRQWKKTKGEPRTRSVGPVQQRLK